MDQWTANQITSNAEVSLTFCRYDLLLNDVVSNSTIGVLQGYSVVLRTHELAQAVYTLATAEGTLQVYLMSMRHLSNRCIL